MTETIVELTDFIVVGFFAIEADFLLIVRLTASNATLTVFIV